MEHVGEIQLNVQPIIVDGTKNKAIQVLNAALALGPYDTDRERRTEAGNFYNNKISTLLLKAQYEAVAAVAVIEARKKLTQRIPLCLTIVGGGVFMNPPAAIKEAINSACNMVEESGVKNIDICLSAYQHGEADAYKTAHFEKAPVLNQDALARLARLSDYEDTAALKAEVFSI